MSNTNIRFKCPKCGGYMFGTTAIGTHNETGHCHDYLPSGFRCTFTWHRPSEDDDVFKVHINKGIDNE